MTVWEPEVKTEPQTLPACSAQSEQGLMVLGTDKQACNLGCAVSSDTSAKPISLGNLVLLA